MPDSPSSAAGGEAEIEQAIVVHPLHCRQLHRLLAGNAAIVVSV
jgi:hypothetical protein